MNYKDVRNYQDYQQWLHEDCQSPKTVPTLSEWACFAGGTMAKDGSHSYQIPVLDKNGSFITYTIHPPVIGFREHELQVSDLSGTKTIGKYRLPQSAAKAAKEHFKNIG